MHVVNGGKQGEVVDREDLNEFQVNLCYKVEQIFKAPWTSGSPRQGSKCRSRESEQTS